MSRQATSREFERWVEAFDQAWQEPLAVARLACPTCSALDLHLVYVVDEPDAPHGMFAFWCGNCLTGFPPNMGPVPVGAQRVRRGEEDVPNYRLVVDT